MFMFMLVMYCGSMYKHTVVLPRVLHPSLFAPPPQTKYARDDTSSQAAAKEEHFLPTRSRRSRLYVRVPYAPVTAFRVCIINHPENEEGRLVSPWRVELAVQTQNAETETTRGRDMRNTTDIVFANSSLA